MDARLAIDIHEFLKRVRRPGADVVELTTAAGQPVAVSGPAAHAILEARELLRRAIDPVPPLEAHLLAQMLFELRELRAVMERQARATERLEIRRL